MDQQSAMASRASGPEVMISYSSKDRPRVLELVQRLRAHGVAVWIDHGGIDGAQRWSEEIVNAIDACKTVILMVSQSSAQSDNIAKEVALAWENGKHFLPLYLEEAKIPKSMQYQLAGIQHIRLFDGDPETKFISVLRSLARLDVHISAYASALVSADSGDKEQAFECLNRACELRLGALARLKSEPRFAILRGDPRYAALADRVESLTLEPEESAADLPLTAPRVAAGTSGPAPWWKRIFWPDIIDDHSARQATAQGIWACAFIVGATILASILSSARGKIAVVGLGWNEPIVVALVFGPIAFGIFKMGRPAAIVALVLCSLGAFGNLGVLRATGAAVDAYNQVPEQYRNQNVYDPYSAYYYAWFSLAISLACVAALTNATRGTFAYREMVQAGRARDKQDAINRDEWSALKAQALARLSSLTSKRTVTSSRPQAAPQLVAPAVPVIAQQVPAQEIQPAVAAQLPNVVIVPAATKPAMAAPVSFAALIGVGSGGIDWLRVAVFLAANLLAGLFYFAALAATTSLTIVGGYWLFAIGQACVFTVATVAALRLIRNPWVAALTAGIVTTIVVLPFYAGLPGFLWSDLFYREQFQQFILLPIMYHFAFVAALALLVPRLQPLALALWMGSMSAEIATPLFAALLRGLGAKESPDPVLASGSLVSALCRSLVFTAVLWAGRMYLTRKREA